MRCEAWRNALAIIALGAVALFAGTRLPSAWRAPTGGASHSLRRLLELSSRPDVAGLFRPMWNDSVLPANVASQQLPMVKNPHYGLHVFALGNNGSLWHKFQTGAAHLEAPLPYAPMSPWHCLTPNSSLVWGNDPAVALNADGHIELFVGLQRDSMDLWQMYQTNASDPLSWSLPRGPTCICDAPDPMACPWCIDCPKRPECKQHYWLGYAPFTTSDPEVFLDPVDSMLKLNFRNFDGHLYQLSQQEPGNSVRWSSETVQFAIFE